MPKITSSASTTPAFQSPPLTPILRSTKEEVAAANPAWKPKAFMEPGQNNTRDPAWMEANSTNTEVRGWVEHVQGSLSGALGEAVQVRAKQVFSDFDQKFYARLESRLRTLVDGGAMEKPVVFSGRELVTAFHIYSKLLSKRERETLLR